MRDNLCSKKLKTMSLSASLASLMAYQLSLMDDIIIGNLINEQAVGGVGLLSPLNTFIIFIASVITNGVVSSIICEIGQFHKNRANAYFTNGIVLSIAAGIVLCCTMNEIKDVFLLNLDTNAITYQYASEYYKNFIWVALLYPMFAFIQQVVYTDGDELLYISSFVIELVGNIVFSVLLCRCMGISGISLGSAASIFVALCILSIHFVRKQNSFSLNFRTSRKKMRSIGSNGFAGACPLLFTALFSLCLNQYFTEVYGEAQLPVLAVAVNIVELASIFSGFGLAASPLIAIYDGECNTKKLRYIISFSCKGAIIGSVVASVLLILFSTQISVLFGITTPSLIQESSRAITIICLSYAASSYVNLVFSYHTTVGPLSFAAYLAAFSNFVITFIVVFPLSTAFGMKGIWFGLCIAPFLSVLIMRIIIGTKYGKGVSPFLFYKDDIPHVYSIDFALTPENVLSTQEQINRLLSAYNVKSSTKNYINLLIEDVFMLVTDKNPGKTLAAECTIKFGDEILLVMKDDGVLFDITDTDMQISSFRAFTVASIMQRQTQRINMTTLCCNRNAFRFPMETEPIPGQTILTYENTPAKV